MSKKNDAVSNWTSVNFLLLLKRITRITTAVCPQRSANTRLRFLFSRSLCLTRLSGDVDLTVGCVDYNRCTTTTSSSSRSVWEKNGPVSDGSCNFLCCQTWTLQLWPDISSVVSSSWFSLSSGHLSRGWTPSNEWLRLSSVRLWSECLVITTG